MNALNTVNTLSRLVALCKRRGFIFPSSEIYGGMNGFWDYGPLGTALKNNIRDAWWGGMVDRPPTGPNGDLLQIQGLDSSIILNPSVWRASGHSEGFHDELVDCRQSKARYRADHLLCVPVLGLSDVSVNWLAIVDGEDVEERLRKRLAEVGKKFGIKSASSVGIALAVPYSELPVEQREWVMGPEATAPGTLTEPRAFNLMLKTSVGALQGSETSAYLRPETAQGIFINFKNVVDAVRPKMPFGIAQIGKAFRNEITPRNFIFRSREFEQMELEWFCEPETSPMWFEYWVQQRREWWRSIGVSDANISLRPHGKDELSHYSTACTDVEYRYPFSQGGFGELEGIAHRGDFDLSQHQVHSKQKLQYLDQATGRSYLPHVIEPSAGLTRAVLAVLCDAYYYDEARPSPETLRLSPKLAPIKVAVFPLTNKDGLPEMANRIFQYLRVRYVTHFDSKQSIGKRYAKMDEIGTPLCVTVDGDSQSDGSVTVRHRDTCLQERVSTARLEEYLRGHLQLAPMDKLEDAFKI